jgi:hypothetical protein
MAGSSPQTSSGADPAAPPLAAAGPGASAGDAPAPGSGAAESSRPAHARRLDDPQRIEGGGRWSVDATRRRCSRCSRPLEDHQPFHTTLEPATESADPTGEVFARRDTCEPCFAGAPPERAFAHWRSVLPPPPGGVRKIVNLASLLAHFHSLVEVVRGDRGEGPPGADELPAAPTTQRLIYLLALFLVRRRMLRWEGVEGGILRLRCRESDRPIEVSVPPLPPAELESAIAEFEELFR